MQDFDEIYSKYFSEVFAKYDDLNASIQENVSAIRVVKAYVREDFEKQRFRDLHTDAECEGLAQALANRHGHLYLVLIIR